MYEGTWTVSPCPHGEAGALAEALGVSETTARVLVRRGYEQPEEAKAFLAGELPGHDPFLLGDMADAVETIRGAIAAGKRICVHGDYDADGICATALAVLILRELGADVEWHLPSRFEEGYGLQRETLARLAEEGCGLVLTVDCGVTAVEEVAEARANGLDVVVTDHHRPGETLPDCPVVATRPSDYPFPELCGTGVVYKLGEALLGPDSELLARHLDLVALATISDVVPLVDENRALALAGLRSLARTQKPGLRALMKSADVDPARVDESAVGFRLAPRINASGRLGRPSSALELLLTEDPDEAGKLAHQLEELNRERQGVEDRILREAIAKVDEWPEAKQRRRGYVLADEGWHEGVIGIVASRLVERFHRPVVLIAGARGGMEGVGPLVPELLTCTAASRPAPSISSASAAIARRPACRSGRRTWRRLRRLSPTTLTLRSPKTTCVRSRRSTRSSPAPSSTLDLCAELGSSPRSGSETRASRCCCPPPSSPSWPRSATASTSASAFGSAAATPARDRIRPGRAARPLPPAGALRRRLPPRGEPLERHGRAAARRAPGLDAPEGYEGLREWLAKEWRPARPRDTERAVVFAELGLSGGARAEPARVGGVPGAARRACASARGLGDCVAERTISSRVRPARARRCRRRRLNMDVISSLSERGVLSLRYG